MERLLVGWGGGLGQPSQMSERGELNAGQACRTRRSTTAKSSKGKLRKEERIGRLLWMTAAAPGATAHAGSTGSSLTKARRSAQ